MSSSTSTRCRRCIDNFKAILSAFSDLPQPTATHDVKYQQANDSLEKLGLWIGNIGALHGPHLPLSLEYRLRDDTDVLDYVQGLLDDLIEVTEDLLIAVSGRVVDKDESTPADEEEEEASLLTEVQSCIQRLFRISTLIREANPQDRFAKALSRDRYCLNSQFDIAHVAEKFPKLASDESSWLRRRLGQAITHRRHYLRYIRDHRDQLENGNEYENLRQDKQADPDPRGTEVIAANTTASDFRYPHSSAVITQASSHQPGQILSQLLTTPDQINDEDDFQSYTTLSRSTLGEDKIQLSNRIPKLEELRHAGGNEVECPFCFRYQRFKNNKSWFTHVYSDLRSYVCTFPGCEGLYFQDINGWFSHEMTAHRVQYFCQLCPDNKLYEREEQYLGHVQTQHTSLMARGGGDYEPILDFARQPLNKIPTKDCPCCYGWTESIRAQEQISSDVPDRAICVTATRFKRHLASHLEQLALFALPTRSWAGEKGSKVALESVVDGPLLSSNRSPLTFSSPEASLSDFEAPPSTERRTGSISDAEATDDTDDHGFHGKVPTILDYLGNNRYRPYQWKGTLSDLHEAISVIRNALEEPIEKDQAAKCKLWSKLSNALFACFKQSGNLADLEEAIEVAREALNNTPLVDLHRAGRVRSLASKLLSHHETTREATDLEEASRLLQQNLESLAGYHLNHPEHLAWQHALATAYLSQGKQTEATELLEHVVAVQQKTLGDTHPELLASQLTLAAAHQEDGRIEDAVKLLEHVVVEHQKRGAEKSRLELVGAQHALSRAYQANGQIKAAIGVLRRIAVELKGALGEDYLGRLLSRLSLAETYQDPKLTLDQIEYVRYKLAEKRVLRRQALQEASQRRSNSRGQINWPAGL